MRRHGFTLIELLVAIGVVAILLGLLLPTLGTARVRAGETKALAQIRDLGITMELYLQSHRSVYPWHEPGEPYIYAPPGLPAGGLMTTSDDPWSMRYLWADTMHQVAPWQEHYVSWLGARPALDANALPWRGSEGYGAYPAYEYSNSFIGDPACWLPTGNARPRPIRQPAVRFPSSKALMYDRARNYLTIATRDNPRRAVLAADASAAMRDDREAAPPVQNRARPNMGVMIYQDTPGGVLGRDF
jgi:prepilin-type N-terminal cleavage/methylation domain-containing protein